MKRLLVVIGAMLAAFAVLLFTKKHNADRWRAEGRTVSALLELVDPLEAYAADHKEYPQGTSTDELREALVPKYVGALSLRDGWGRPLNVIVNRQNYLVWSIGSNGRRDKRPWLPPEKARAPFRHTLLGNAENDDLVMYNGDLVQYQDGLSTPPWTWNVTVLDAHSDRANTGVVRVEAADSAFIQIRRNGITIAENALKFELPPGEYAIRAILSNLQIYDEPATITVERGRVLNHIVNLPVKSAKAKP
jgi:hypothetical protein